MTEKDYDEIIANAYAYIVANYFVKNVRPSAEVVLSVHKCRMKCSLCKTTIRNALDSHNAMPLSENRCCTECNYLKVIPARISMFDDAV